MHHILLLGGDQRQPLLNRILAKNGYSASIYYEHLSDAFSMEEALRHNDIILCPVPFTKDNKSLFSINALKDLDIIQLLKYLTPDHRVFGGNIPSLVTEYTSQNHIPCYDYMQMEDITLANTLATAEGAISEAICLSPLCLHGSNCLVTGFGRCGKTLAMKLKGLDAQVTVADRDSAALSFAGTLGLKTEALGSIENHAGNYTFLFNTIPAPVIGENIIRKLNPDVTIIDIASAPGGVDFPECGRLNIRARLCPGLPGIYAPQAAAEILYQGIVKHLS